VFRLVAGEAEFSVKSAGARQWRVHAEGLTATVLGTRFKVRAVSGRGDVIVYRGRVLVELADREAPVILSAGQNLGSLLEEPGVDRPAPEMVKAKDEGALLETAPLKGHEPSRPLGSKHAGKRAEAVAPVLRDRGPLEEADRARASGDFEEAARLLRDFLKRHPEANEAPFAAFSLGELEMDHLDRPEEAEQIFLWTLQDGRLPEALRTLVEKRLSKLWKLRARQ
jgi:hypothetical protein